MHINIEINGNADLEIGTIMTNNEMVYSDNSMFRIPPLSRLIITRIEDGYLYFHLITDVRIIGHFHIHSINSRKCTICPLYLQSLRCDKIDNLLKIRKVHIF